MANLTACLRKAGIPSELAGEIRATAERLGGDARAAVSAELTATMDALEDIRRQVQAQGVNAAVRPLAPKEQDETRRMESPPATREADPPDVPAPAPTAQDETRQMAAPVVPRRVPAKADPRAEAAVEGFKSGTPEKNARRLRDLSPSVLRVVNRAAQSDPQLHAAVEAAWAWADEQGFGGTASVNLAELPPIVTEVPDAAPIQTPEDAIETRKTLKEIKPAATLAQGLTEALAVANAKGNATVKAQKMAELTGLDFAYTMDALFTAKADGRNVTMEDLGVDPSCGL
jgi:hypothetical protein